MQWTTTAHGCSRTTIAATARVVNYRLPKCKAGVELNGLFIRWTFHGVTPRRLLSDLLFMSVGVAGGEASSCYLPRLTERLGKTGWIFMRW